MRKYLSYLSVIMVLLTLGSSTVQAQEGSKVYKRLAKRKGYQTGYIIKKALGKEEGLIKYNPNQGDPASMYQQVEFVSKSGVKWRYQAREIEGYGFDKLEFISNRFLFYQVILKGKPVSLYWIKEATGFFNMDNPTESGWYCVKKEGETDFKRISNISKKRFKKEFTEYFKDCPKLVEMIESETGIRNNVHLVVRTFNGCEFQ